MSRTAADIDPGPAFDDLDAWTYTDDGMSEGAGYGGRDATEDIPQWDGYGTGTGTGRKARDDQATEKQVRFILSLAAERGMEVDTVTLTKREASKLIDKLMALPRPARKAPAPQVNPHTAPPAEGMHRTTDGTIYRVVTSQQGRLYAKLLVVTESGARFDYAAGAISKLNADTQMTLEEAKAFGVETGTCCVCARELTNPKSVEAGIGPVCAGRF